MKYNFVVWHTNSKSNIIDVVGICFSATFKFLGLLCSLHQSASGFISVLLKLIIGFDVRKLKFSWKNWEHKNWKINKSKQKQFLHAIY